jgi:hypothetical protein
MMLPPLGLLLLLAAPVTGTLPALPSSPPAATHCPPEGKGGDALQNIQKNRIQEPETFLDWDVPKMLQLTRDYGFRKKQRRRANWTPEARAEIEARENTAVALTGYIVGYKAGPAEAANCNASDAHDMHVQIFSSPFNPKENMGGRSVIVEITPRFRAAHPSWNVKALEKLRDERTPVRVRGWLMYDPEHPGTLDKLRATLWEIHPVLAIEVRRGEKWEPL